MVERPPLFYIQYFMKNYTYLLFCLLFGQLAIGQNIKATLMDSETNLPIQQIAVISDDESFFGVTNDKGEVILPENLINQTVFVDDYLYMYEEKTLKSSEDFVWELQPNSETLEELLIYKNPKPVLQEVIDNSIKSFSTDAGLETYFSSKGSVATYSHFSTDAIVNVYMKPDNVVDIAVVQCRAKEELNEEEKNSISLSSRLAHPSNFSQVLYFEQIKEMLDQIKHYEISITSKKVGESTIHTCYFYPKEKSKKKMMIAGYFSYNADKKLILEVKYDTPEEKVKYNKMNVLIASVRDVTVSYHIKYAVTENHYYPTYSQYAGKALVRAKIAKIDTKMDFVNEFFILSDQPRPISQNQLLNENPIDIGDRYTEKFWTDPRIQNHE